MFCYQVQSQYDDAHDENAYDARHAPTLARASTAALLLLLNRACKISVYMPVYMYVTCEFCGMDVNALHYKHTLVVVVWWRKGDFIGLQILLLPVRCWQRWIDVRCRMYNKRLTLRSHLNLGEHTLLQLGVDFSLP